LRVVGVRSDDGGVFAIDVVVPDDAADEWDPLPDGEPAGQAPEADRVPVLDVRDDAGSQSTGELRRLVLHLALNRLGRGFHAAVGRSVDVEFNLMGPVDEFLDVNVDEARHQNRLRPFIAADFRCISRSCDLRCCSSISLSTLWMASIQSRVSASTAST